MEYNETLRYINLSAWAGFAIFSFFYSLIHRRFFYFFAYSIILLILLSSPFYFVKLIHFIEFKSFISFFALVCLFTAAVLKKIVKIGLISLKYYKKQKLEFSNNLNLIIKFSPILIMGSIFLPTLFTTIYIVGIIIDALIISKIYFYSQGKYIYKILSTTMVGLYTISSFLLSSTYFPTNLLIPPIYYELCEIYLSTISMVMAGIWAGKITNLQTIYAKRIIQIEIDKKTELLKINESINEKIKNETEKLNEILSIKKFYLGIISHDLRGPLNEAIFLLKQTNKKNKGFIQSQIDRLETINESFYLFLNWIEAKNFNKSRVFKVLNLDDQLTNILLEFEDAIGTKKIQIKKSVPSDLTLFFNYIFIETILRNIIGNAIKFNRMNGFIEIIAIKRAQFTSIAIKDNGEGVFQAHIDGILANPVNKIGTKKEDSFGFGLFICKEIIEQYGGSIKVKSKPNSGTTVILKFKNENKTINS